MSLGEILQWYATLFAGAALFMRGVAQLRGGGKLAGWPMLALGAAAMLAFAVYGPEA